MNWRYIHNEYRIKKYENIILINRKYGRDIGKYGLFKLKKEIVRIN